jgi:hypothetical protein
VRKDNIPPGYITQKEIQAAQRYYRIGRTVIVHTYKAQGIDSMGHTGEMHRGKIVEHYKRFALVRLPSGVLDSVLWPDLVLQMRKKKNPGITSPEIKN